MPRGLGFDWEKIYLLECGLFTAFGGFFFGGGVFDFDLDFGEDCEGGFVFDEETNLFPAPDLEMVFDEIVGNDLDVGLCGAFWGEVCGLEGVVFALDVEVVVVGAWDASEHEIPRF